MKSLSGLITQ